MITPIKDRVILDLCGGTGSWSKPYTDAGYPTLVVDPLTNGQDVRIFKYRYIVWGILAAPPCTCFSYARNRYPPTDEEFTQALSVVDACIRIVTSHSEIKWWALENPINKLRWFLGQPQMTFRHYDYGDGPTKRTGIWGRFTIPAKNPGKIIRPYGHRMWRPNALPIDAITHSGFANAFFKANP